MSNLPESLYGDPSGAGSSSNVASHSARGELDGLSVEQLIKALRDPPSRERVLQLLCGNKEIGEDLAPLLWNSPHTIFILLEEIMAVYRLLSSPNLTREASNHVCNALALLQRIASHPDTRMLFVKANIPLYVYPFLNTTNKGNPHDYLRLTSLGVVGALVKEDDAGVIHFLLSTEILPYCLRCMEMGNELSKTVATFIVHKILMHEKGLKYCCIFGERFLVIVRVLGNMVEELAEEPSQRLLKHIINCYLRLSENSRACEGLRTFLPLRFRDANFINLFLDDPSAIEKLKQLFYNVATGQRSKTQAAGEKPGRLMIKG